MICKLTIDEQPFQFPLEGEVFWGENVCHYDAEDNPIGDTPWRERGWTIIPLFSPEQSARFVEGTRELVIGLLRAEGVSVDDRTFRLEDYHRYADDTIHQAVISKSRWLTFEQFCLDAEAIAARISDELARPISLRNPKLERDFVILRISRPKTLDINPPHRDGYLDIWKDTVNLWLPVAGCSQATSLPIIPGSHLWRENDILRTESGHARIGGLSYHVPGIVDSSHGLSMIRPNPQLGEALVFTPFLIHGAAVNQTSDTTRMSFEIRLHSEPRATAA